MFLAQQFRFPRLTRIGFAMGSMILFSSCTPKPRPATAALGIIKPLVVGEVAVVDEEKHFVLIDLGANLYVPSAGAELRSANASGGIAHLKASAERKRPFIAADIVDGEPGVGDQVIR